MSIIRGLALSGTLFFLLIPVSSSFAVQTPNRAEKETQTRRTLPAPVVSPTQIVAGSTQPVLVTLRYAFRLDKRAKITLYREQTGVLSPRKDSWSPVGDLVDNGTSGDASAGDGVFSRLLSLNEPAPGALRLRAALQNEDDRFWSPPVSISILLSMPNLLHLQRSEAQQKLLASGLLAGNLSETPRLLQSSGTVIQQTPAPTTPVTLGSSVDLLIVATPSAKPGENLPASWEGLWQFDNVYRDGATDRVNGAVQTTDNLCTDDPLGLGLLEQVAASHPEAGPSACTGQVLDDQSRSSCTSQIVYNLCTLNFRLEINLKREGESILGMGSWQVDKLCGLPFPGTAQTFSITGRRKGPVEAGACAKPVSSWIQKFLKNPSLGVLGEVL